MSSLSDFIDITQKGRKKFGKIRGLEAVKQLKPYHGGTESTEKNPYSIVAFLRGLRVSVVRF